MSMDLLRLVIVDDEAILLQGLVETYDWAEMGFEVTGTAQSGEEALKVIRRERPHVVLTDIRMKQMTGLAMMEKIQQEEIPCLFVVLSAYRDFKYAQQACDLGAFAYLLKPIEDEKLQETMKNAYDVCMEQIKNEAKYESWEKLIKKDEDSFLQVVVQKYVQGRMPYEKVEEVFSTLEDVPNREDRFIAVCVGVDLAYKITSPLEYEAAKLSLSSILEQEIGAAFFFWQFEDEEENMVFLVKTKENVSVRTLKEILENVKGQIEQPVFAAISKPYKGIPGMKRSFEEAKKLLGLASVSGTSAFAVPSDIEVAGQEMDTANAELMIVNAVRKNEQQELKLAFVHFIYCLPKEEEQQKQYLHKAMLKTEFMIKDSYGMTEDLKEQFQNYYSNLNNLNAAKAVDVCYKILGSAIEKRLLSLQSDESKAQKEYISDAVAYIEEHLHEEELSIGAVAAHAYLNPVYFGRVFKQTFEITFKQYLLQRRMERAKLLLEDGRISIGDICDRVGVGNPSYFAHLFKQYTGKLPSEYKKEYEG